MVVAVYDACVLYPAPLRDFLLHLAAADVVQARWSAQIHEEWIRAVLSNRRDLTRAQLERTRRLMDANVRDCLVHGYEVLIDQLELPDKNDRHVLAAAIVTFNVKQFPDERLRRYGILAAHPDDFVAAVALADVPRVLLAARTHRSNLTRPSKSVSEYIATLEMQGLKKMARLLRPHESEI